MQIHERTFESPRHRSFYLEAGPPEGPVIIFCHGWPELSLSWRNQLPYFAERGFRCIAPDMRGYGRSTVHPEHSDYALRETVADMIELLDHLGADKAVWVGHDWGTPVVWSIAQHHPDRCHAVAGLCVPYQPQGFAVETALPLCNREVYPEEQFPAAQWDYQLFYRENFEAARQAFESNVTNTVRILFRSGKAEGKGQPVATATIRSRGGWFPGGGAAPPAPRDPAVLSEAEEAVYVEALTRNGFFGPDSWYMNHEANLAYAEEARDGWRLKMPVLFFHGAYDYVCETLDSRLAEPMRAHCDDLTERVVESGHWMAQEKPDDVNAGLDEWLKARVFA
jgi:pimeloyl-ACP methyl ester carboxylesterase